MELPIFNAIAGGTLHPKFTKSPRGTDIPFGDLNKQLIRGTKDLKEIEDSLLFVLDGYVKVANETTKAVHLDDIEATYSVQSYVYEVRYDSSTGKARTDQEKFYKTLLEKERTRIMMFLQEYAANAKNDFDAKMQIIETLENIIRVGEMICCSKGLIFDWLRITLIKLYVEICSHYYYLIKEEELMTFIDLYCMMFRSYPSSEQLNGYMKTFLKGRIQQCISNGEVPSKRLRDDLYTILNVDQDEEFRRLALWMEYYMLARRYGIDQTGLHEPQIQKAVLRMIRKKLLTEIEEIPERIEKEKRIILEMSRLKSSIIEESPANTLRNALKQEYEKIEKEPQNNELRERNRKPGLCLRYDCTNDNIRDCYTVLIKKGLLDSTTPYMTFKKILTGGATESKINWAGTLPELTAFVKALKSENLLIDTIGYWDKVALSFRHHDQPLTSKQLRSQHESDNDRKATANAVWQLTQQSEL